MFYLVILPIAFFCRTLYTTVSTTAKTTNNRCYSMADLAGKPAKPRADFPLTAHASGYWCKKIRGKIHYFGSWRNDRSGASAERLYELQRADLFAGRVPRGGDGQEQPTLRWLINKFLTDKRADVDAGELSVRSWADLHYNLELLSKIIPGGKCRLVADLGPADFSAVRQKVAAAKTVKGKRRGGPVALTNLIQRTRSLFKWAYESELIEKPVRFGPEFKKPSRKSARIRKAKAGKKLFSRDELLTILGAAKQPMRTMVLLGINAGLGNHDVALLEPRHLDLATGWLDYPRPKTGIGRRAKLWPETIAGIREAMKRRKKSTYIFLTKFGSPFFRDAEIKDGKLISDSPISKEFRKLLDKLKLPPGRNFYVLRHTFRTVADGTRDQVAVNHVMGHADESMASVYRESIEDSRLEAVAEYVRAWLWPK